MTKQRRSNKKQCYAKSSPKSESNSGKNFDYDFELFDKDGPFGKTAKSPEEWPPKVLTKLKDYKTMTWQEIKGKGSHSISLEKLAPEAQKRLQEIKLDHIRRLFSLCIHGSIRIFGIVHGDVLKIIWYDPEHQICPCRKK